MSIFSIFHPQLAKIMPYIIYIAIAAAYTSPTVTEWPNIHSRELEHIARWAYMLINYLHSISKYNPVEEGNVQKLCTHILELTNPVAADEFMPQILSWIVSAIVEYRDFVRTVAGETMAEYDFVVGMDSQNKELRKNLLLRTAFIHLVGSNDVSAFVYCRDSELSLRSDNLSPLHEPHPLDHTQERPLWHGKLEVHRSMGLHYLSKVSYAVH